MRPRKAILTAALVALLGVAGFVYFRGEDRAGPRASDADEPLGRAPGFREAALESGLRFRMRFLPNEQGEKFKINLYDHGCGVAVGDFDGDGLDDVYFLNQLGPNALYRNQGDGTFRDTTRTAGVAVGDRICVGATFADYDNDGDQDLFVTSTRGGNLLFQNQGDGTFRDTTKEAGVGLVAHCQTATFFDYDSDGLLDLFVTCTAEWTTNQYDSSARYFTGLSSLWEMARCRKEPNVLYRNRGNGTFEDVTAKAGVEGQGWGGDVAVFDYNDDGRPDLFVTSMFGVSRLYRNNGDGTFADVTHEALGRVSWGAIGTKVWDINNDGKLDLLLVDMHSDMWVPLGSDVSPESVQENEKSKYRYVSGPMVERYSSGAMKARFRDQEKMMADTFEIQYEEVLFGNTLFKNLGGGKFEEISDQAGVETFWPWGIATGDFDNDGLEDVFLPSGMGYPYFYWPNYLLMNTGGETFADRARREGIEPPERGVFLDERFSNTRPTRSSRCAAAADFDGDGRLDLVTNNFNDHPYYFRNAFPRGDYLALRLIGVQSNRDAIGAVVRLHCGKGILTRQVQGAGGYLSQSSLTLHFGLGTLSDADRIEKVEIQWPSGVKQTIDHLEVNRLHRVTEPAG